MSTVTVAVADLGFGSFGGDDRLSDRWLEDAAERSARTVPTKMSMAQEKLRRCIAPLLLRKMTVRGPGKDSTWMDFPMLKLVDVCVKMRPGMRVGKDRS